MPERGIFLIMELLIGILLLIPLQHSIQTPNNWLAGENASILCEDLLVLWSYGGNDIELFALDHYPGVHITFSAHPILSKMESGVSCHGVRIENGEVIENFIAIEW